MKELRIGFTGGGTGGHIYPLLAVAQEVSKELKEKRSDPFSLYYFGSPDRYAPDFINLGIKIVRIVPFKLRRYFSLENIIDFFKFPVAIIQAFIKLLFIMPDVVFSKGGPGSVAVVWAAWFYRIPVFIHETDSVPSLSAKLSLPFATRIGVSFSKTLESIKSPKAALVGNPLRSLLLEPELDLTPDKAKRLFGFDPALPLILVLGGSQGSTRLNEFILDNAGEFVGHYQILHQIGPQNFSQFKNEAAVATKNFIPEQRSRYKIVDFLVGNQYKEALIACDVIVARSGGNIFEIAASKKPSILIPFPEAAGNHQVSNAYEYAKNSACIVIEESNLTSSLFFSQLRSILENKEKYSAMSSAAGSFSKLNAAILIAQELIRLASR